MPLLGALAGYKRKEQSEALLNVFKEPGEKPDERWLSSMSKYNCAICENYRFKGN
jgi:hypothetical protein